MRAASTPPAEILHRVQQLIEQGDLKTARSELTRALKAFPREAGFYNLLGVVEAQQGNYGAAESNFKEAIEAAPRSAGAYLNLGRLYQENASKDPEAVKKALGTYRRLLRFQPNDAEANYQSAVLLQRQASYKASLDHLTRLPQAAQERPQALAVLCADLAGLGERSQAEKAADQLLASPDLTEADVLSILPTLEAREQGALAARLLEGIVERQLASSGTLRQLGILYERLGKLDRARTTFERAAQGQSNLVPLLLDLARVANQQQDRKGALGYLAHARDLDPQNAAIHFFFGMVCVEENLAQEAYTSLKKAVALDPNNPYYHYAFGAVAVQREYPREAIPAFQRYCELKPHDLRGKLALGAAYFYSHESELARKELEAVAKYGETAVGAHYFLGRIANQEGNFSEALRELKQALEKSPEYAEAYAELGLVHLKQRNYAQAEEALLRALGIDPENYVAHLNLMILFQRTKDPRAAAQAERFEEVKKKRSERTREFLRTIEVRP